MTITINHHHYIHGYDNEVKDLLKLAINKINTMGEKTNLALAGLEEIKTALTKIGGESILSLQKITELEQAAANNDTPQEVLDKIAEVKAQAKVVDDLIPDAEPPAV